MCCMFELLLLFTVVKLVVVEAWLARLA
jgi:hypothetical protein